MPPVPDVCSLPTEKVSSRSPEASSSTDSERSVPPRPLEQPPYPPPASDINSGISGESIDELIGLAPSKIEPEDTTKSILQKMGRSLTKVKGQTGTVWSRITRRSSDMGDDLLDLGNEPPAVTQDFVVDVDLVPPAVPEPTNDDVVSIFGMKDAMEEGDSDDEEGTVRRNSGSVKNNFELLLQMLAMCNLVNQNELDMLVTTVPNEKVQITRIVLDFVEKSPLFGVYM